MNMSLSKATDTIGVRSVARSWDQRSGLTLGLEWARGPWHLGAIASAHSGWPTTQLLRTADGSVALGPRNAVPLPRVASLDLHAEYRRPMRLGSLAISLDITNATNRHNICCTEIDVDRNALATPILDADSRTWLPLVPSLKLDWEF